MKKISNKQLVLDFYKKVIAERNSDVIDLYVSDSYIQHSPTMKDGKRGLREAIEYLKTLPQPPQTKSPVIVAIAEEEYVMLLLDLAFMGRHLSVVDLFKVVDGMIIEHWDAIEDITAKDFLVPEFDGKVANESREVMRDLVESLYNNPDSLITTLKDRGKVEIYRMIIENGTVGVQSKGHQFGEAFVFYDFIQLENSTVVSFWSVKQAIPGKINHNNGMI